MKRRDPTAEELELWRRAMRNTRPLPGREPDSQAEEAPVRPPPPAKSTRSERAAGDVKGGGQHEAAAAQPRHNPPPGGVDAATQRRLRRGRLQIDARIDLHGMYQAQAHKVLNRFLAESQAAGRRCVLVITGKGGRVRENGEAAFMHRPEDGVLRRQVPQWLAQEPNRARVFAVEQAHARHGGSGAFYVFLRRARA